jgi:hypothetical protein
MFSSSLRDKEREVFLSRFPMLASIVDVTNRFGWMSASNFEP